MVFCDVSKSFDRVWHKGLIFKLRQYGIDGDLLNWISDYSDDRKQRVFTRSCMSSFKRVNAGVPQGSDLGPLLFLIFVNDISDSLLSYQDYLQMTAPCFVLQLAFQILEVLLTTIFEY